MKGFTLIEIIIVVGIFTLIIAFASTIDLSAFRRDLFRAEQSTIVSALEKARSRSMTNLFESAHGVCFITPNYIIFRANDGLCDKNAPSNELIPANTNITVTFSQPNIIFSQLAGTTTDATIHITDGTKSADININYEGTINW